MVHCRGCGKEIHETATTCPDCGAPQNVANAATKSNYTSYDDVPWYRKNWFAILCFLFFTPGLIILALSGEIYYQQKGELKTYSQGRKILLIVISIGFIVYAFLPK